MVNVNTNKFDSLNNFYNHLFFNEEMVPINDKTKYQKEDSKEGLVKHKEQFHVKFLKSIQCSILYNISVDLGKPLQKRRNIH